MTERRYEVTVWNIADGDIVMKLWSASEADLEDVEEQYSDEPFHEVVVDREWEEEADDD